MYKKISKSMQFISLFTLTLCTLLILTISYIVLHTAATSILSKQEILLTLTSIIVVIVFLSVLIYLLTFKISSRITEEIIKPFEKPYSVEFENYEDMYEEIQPFLYKISQQNKEIRHNIEELKRAEKIRREFSANVSHELKTPLTTIMGYSQLISKGIAKNEDIPHFTEKIEKEAGRLIILIDDIIKLSVLDDDEVTYEKNAFDLKKTALDVSDRLMQIANKRNISIVVNGEKTIIHANEHQIDEMIYNLIDNAIKYNKENGDVTVTIGTNNDVQFITVKDTGIGIPDKYYDRIFERFFRVDKSHSKKINGTGLGLSIVRHIAIINNAEIHVNSQINKGTEFTVYFK